MTHRCRVVGIGAKRRQWRCSVPGLFAVARAVQLAGMGECGSNGIRSERMPSPEKRTEPKTVILLKTFHEQYPNIRREISAWILDNPGDSDLKEFLFELLAETQPKGE